MSDPDRPWTPDEAAFLRVAVQEGLETGQLDVAPVVASRLQRSLDDVRRRVIDVCTALSAELCHRFGVQPVRPVGVHPEMLERRALAHGITTLYRYRPMRNEAELDRACGEGLYGRFYFPTRAQLKDNDALDLQLKFKMDNEKARDWLRDQMPFSARSDADKAAMMARYEDDAFMARVTDHFNATFAESTCAPFGAVCFTTGGDTNPRFWDEYAGKHSGVCIHWDARTEPLSHAMKVNYSDDAHAVELPDSGSLQFIELMLRKRLCYSWEMEYRLLYLPGHFEPTLVVDRLTHIHPSGIVGITFGADVRADYRREFLWCIGSMIDPLVADPNIPRLFRTDSLPPLYQAQRDKAGVITVKPFRFNAATGRCVF